MRSRTWSREPGAVFVRPTGLSSRLGEEAVEVLAAGAEAVNVHVDGVAELGDRGDLARLHHVPEMRVGRHLPAHPDVLRRHPAALDQRLRCESRPQRHAARARITRGHAEPERIAGKRRRRRGEVAAHPCVQRGAGEGAGERKEPAAVYDPPVELGQGRAWIRHSFPLVRRWWRGPTSFWVAEGRRRKRCSVWRRQRCQARRQVGPGEPAVLTRVDLSEAAEPRAALTPMLIYQPTRA